jgi:hypothetical protein
LFTDYVKEERDFFNPTKRGSQGLRILRVRCRALVVFKK